MAGDGTWVVVEALPECDLHAMRGEKGVEARYDGRTKLGSSWANMCEPCMHALGVGLGVGRGQRLILRGEPTPVTAPQSLDELFDNLTPEGAKLIDEGPDGVTSHSRESDAGWWCFTCGQAKDDGPHRDTAHEPNWVRDDMDDPEALRAAGMGDVADALSDLFGEDD